MESNGKPNFIAASTWEGTKSGYVFNNGAQGTGYYLDEHTQKRDHSSASVAKPGGDSRKRARKTVQIAESNNETRFIQSSEEMLEEAEKKAKSAKVLDLTPRSLKRAAAALTKVFEENEIKRAEYPDDPKEYMESEVALYENISSLKAMAADPAKTYSIALEEGMVSMLVQLLLHSNVDIVTTTISTLVELLETSLVQDNEGELVPPVVAMATMVLQNGVDALVSNLSRIDSDDDSDDDDVGKGVTDILVLIENLMDMDRVVAMDEALDLLPNGLSVAAYLCQETSILGWLFSQIGSNSTLKDRALEILASIASRDDVYDKVPSWTELPPFSSTFAEEKKPEKKEKAETVDGIEVLLQVVGSFRKKQPDGESEVDRLENACLIITYLLTFSQTNVQAFLNAQGIELVLRCLKERVHAGGVAMKWLDMTGNDPVFRTACHNMIDKGLLKFLIPIFMGSHKPKPAESIRSKKARKAWSNDVETNSIRILYSLTRYIDDKSPNDCKARLLAKFATDPAKCDRIAELLLSYDTKARKAEYKFYRSDVEDSLDQAAVELAAQEAKLSGGGDIFHRLGAIAAFLCTGSKRCHERILQYLRGKESGMGLIREAVSEFVSELEEGVQQRNQLELFLKDL